MRWLIAFRIVFLAERVFVWFTSHLSRDERMYAKGYLSATMVFGLGLLLVFLLNGCAP